jgi:hypothetical protein
MPRRSGSPAPRDVPVPPQRRTGEDERPCDEPPTDYPDED